MDAPWSHAIANVEKCGKMETNKSEIYQTTYGVHYEICLHRLSLPVPVPVCHCPCLGEKFKKKNSGSTATLRIIITSEVIWTLVNSATIHQLNVYPREQLTYKESDIRNKHLVQITNFTNYDICATIREFVYSEAQHNNNNKQNQVTVGVPVKRYERGGRDEIILIYLGGEFSHTGHWLISSSIFKEYC